ncbi:uncharacterized protein LOC141607551 [Silene latifolia]|uniref:uncharacterized protein LOC141607551 n=1 Tax=Silene latifolia TaxID=37657 RepID=UPI003D776574
MNCVQRDSIWVHWVQSNYLKGQEWMEYKPSTNSSWVWRRICRVKDEMSAGYVNGQWNVQPGGFTPAGCYAWFIGTRPRVQWVKAVWNRWALPKHQFLGWLAAHEALNTAARLSRFGVDIEDKCSLCGLVSETIEHLFCDCLYSKRIVWQQRNKGRNENVLIHPEGVASIIMEEMRTRVRARDRTIMTNAERDWLIRMRLIE